MGLIDRMKDILASVTSCIGAKGPNREKYVVCVKVQHKLPVTLWYVYKYHTDFVRLYDDLNELASKTACAQECWVGSLLASLKCLLDPSSSQKLICLNQFLQKLVRRLRETDHADVCLLRNKVDAALMVFLEWRDDTRGGLKRQLSLPAFVPAESSAAQSDCYVLDSKSLQRKNQGTFSYSYPAKITKLEAPSPTNSQPLTPLGTLQRSHTMVDQGVSPKCHSALYHDMFKSSDSKSMPVLPSRRRVFTEVNFDGL
ncbi:hypothetical protein Ae201684P_005301 [Aphanomyces euteiches]|uniref:PX domain-containing protein n=1 Tax=Aphanomyces euteiches TaxID=100861 RepID=A0A6G0X118_9STRA|nr:hypothetical protein Ae201684_009716 [Aphanomyces euteiches]KAH9085595.1 hypothetical protein Ae201684P_005301 [Aphanomyces euteiches]KAH9135871.1 hypothetical protein AeRB84_018835 [Aphanomyces euteiches]